MNVNDLIHYIDNAFDRQRGESYWLDENGNDISTDVGYAWEWWIYCMKPELIRVFNT